MESYRDYLRHADLSGEGKDRIQITEELNVKNSVSIKMRMEDHTLGNLLRTELLKDPDVKFVGYKKPHPLEELIEFKLMTQEKKQKDPVQALQICTANVLQAIDDLERQLEEQVRIYHRGI